MPDEVFVLLVIPLAAATAGFTLHYAVKPFVEALIRAIREPAGELPAAGDEITDLRAEVALLQETVQALSAKVEFDRQLAAETGRSTEREHPADTDA